MEAKTLKKKKRKKIIIIVIVAVLIVAAVCGAVAYHLYGQMVDKLGKVNTVSLDKDDLDIDSQVAKDLKDYRNILLLGIDTRAGESDDNCRSDASIILSINKKTNDVKLISVVRDSYMDVEENGTHVLDKLTHAHAYGGPKDTIRAINRNMDMNISEYVRVNWQTVADVVDSMGGITVNVKDYEISEMNKYIKDTNKSLKGDKTLIKKAGKQKLNGIQAVTYCRIRKVGNGDMERSERMRTVIKGTYSKIKEMKLSELSDMADKTLPEITTNISAKSMTSLMLDFSGYEIKDSQGWPYNWDGATINGVSYDVAITLESNVAKLHEKVFGQKNYDPTDRVKEISKQVAEKSGYYGQDNTGQ